MTKLGRWAQTCLRSSWRHGAFRTCVGGAWLIAACSVYDESLLRSAAGTGGAAAGTPNVGGQGGVSGSLPFSSEGGAIPMAAGATATTPGGTTTAEAGKGGGSGVSSMANGGSSTAGVGLDQGGGGMGVSAGAGGESGTSGGDGTVAAEGSGWITQELWTNVPGWAVEAVPVDSPANEVSLIDSFESTATGLDYGVRISGLLTAPLDGPYEFWVACDDNCVLWLSTDETAAHLAAIASILGEGAWAGPTNWDRYSSQHSEPVTLVAGKRYRIEAIVKQGIGGGNLLVGWRKPGEMAVLPPEILPGRQLSPRPL